MEIVHRLLNGDRRALARAITIIENQEKQTREIMSQIHPKTGSAHVIGITGSPGSGKSSLVNKLVEQYRESKSTVGILAIDPSSPFTGGAILGDRIRMLHLTADEGVYIRSMASRGQLGGLAKSTFDAVRLLDAFGFDKIIIETVGAGQSEVDIVRICDTTIVITVPGFGDDIQMIKAGIMEIANVFVVNKSDLPNAKQLALQIKNMMELIPETSNWHIPIVQTSAISGLGVSKLHNKLEDHWNYLATSKELQSSRKARKQTEIISYVLNMIKDEIDGLDHNNSIKEQIELSENDEPVHAIAEKVYRILKSAK